MTYIKPSELSYKWKLPLLLEAINEVLNDSSIKYSLTYSKDLDTEEEFKAAMHVENGVDENDTITYMDSSAWPSQLTWSAVKTKWDAKIAAQPLTDLRGQRNDLLAETDWMANSDVTISDSWKTYRQQLRDLPANTSDPANPTWPTKPS
jgi:hypothetical protein|tara:strand:+ start:455 stop:901 length:447 start_codon:yes stop_codon:yes gene_type:complete